jgi:hypothetical protein
MNFVKLRWTFIWASAAAAFALCWAGTISSFGLAGVYLGWIAAAIVAPLAAIVVSVVWSAVALTVLLGWHVHACERGGGFNAKATP